VLLEVLAITQRLGKAQISIEKVLMESSTHSKAFREGFEDNAIVFVRPLAPEGAAQKIIRYRYQVEGT
jgi:hypothetical protein